MMVDLRVGSTGTSPLKSSLQGAIDMFLGQMVEYLRPLILWGCLANPIPYKFIQKTVMLIGPPNFVDHLTFTLVDSACLTKMFATEAYFPLCFQKFQTNFRCIFRKFWRPEVRVGLRTSTAWWEMLRNCRFFLNLMGQVLPIYVGWRDARSGGLGFLWFVYVFRHPALPTRLLVVFIQWSIHGGSFQLYQCSIAKTRLFKEGNIFSLYSWKKLPAC